MSGKYLVFLRKEKIAEAHDLTRLFTVGQKIQRLPAWRLSKGRGIQGLPVRPYSRRFFRSRETMHFGPKDSVLVYNPVTGYQATHNRRWFLSFVVSLWVAARFQYKKVGWDIRQFGVNGNPYFLGDMVRNEIRTFWPEVKKFVKGRYNIDIDEAAKFQKDLRDKVYQTGNSAELKEAAPFYSIAERANGRLLEVALSVDKKAEAEEKQNEFMEEFKEIFKGKLEEAENEPKSP